MIEFNKKINYQRNERNKQEKIIDPYSIIGCFESDRGRILNSAAIRRLQQKTQVFPLERNSVVRTRLTHSMEVQQVGRYIVKEIIHRLSNAGKLAQLKLEQVIMPIESLVEMACLMHDIGNPPFGHFGEKAINQWFGSRLKIHASSYYPVLEIQETDNTELQELKNKIRQDLCNFEGNAQAIRLVHTILRLNLTYSQIASILKYSKPAYWLHEVPVKFSYLMKKPGYYLSEEIFIKELSEQLDIQPFHRYPLTYIMEAADDISYCIADLEDAVEKKLFSVQQLYNYLEDAWGPIKSGDLFDKVVKRSYDEYLGQNQFRAIAIGQFFINLRVKTITKLVSHAAERFIENIEEIYHGSFNNALLEGKGAEYKLLNIFKTVGIKYVFNHESVENIELQGHRIISGLLDIYSPLLDMPTHDFLKLVKDDNHKEYPIETRLYHKLSAKHRDAYQQAIKNKDETKDTFQSWEFYYRCRLLQDYISGMTDHFAFDEYRKLMVTF